MADLVVGKNSSQCLWAGMHPRAKNSHQYLVRRIRRSRIWSCAQDYAVLVILLNMVQTLIPDKYDRKEMFSTSNLKLGPSYCILSVVSPISKIIWLTSSLELCCHVPLNRNQLDWDWRMRLKDNPNEQAVPVSASPADLPFWEGKIGGACQIVFIDIFWKLGWLNHTCALCNRIARLLIWRLEWDHFLINLKAVMCVPLRSHGKGMWRESWWFWTELCEREQWNRESSYEKKWPIFFRIASESERVFAKKIDACFRCLSLSKMSVFR